MKLKLEAVTKGDLARIHGASLKILKETGCVFQDEGALQIFKKHGAKVDGKTVYLSETMVENAMQTVPRTFKWRARNDAFSTIIGGEGYRLGPNSGNVFVQDLDNGRRQASLADIVHENRRSRRGALPPSASRRGSRTSHSGILSIHW